MLTNQLQTLCTNRCTESSHLSPTTVISTIRPYAILLKTLTPQQDSLPVAPNVAGSNPVSHPNFTHVRSLTVFFLAPVLAFLVLRSFYACFL